MWHSITSATLQRKELLMKLTKDTRELIKLGTHLTQKDMELVVTNIIELPKGKQITTKIIKHPNPVWVNHTIYAQAMSWYYGMNITE